MDSATTVFSKPAPVRLLAVSFPTQSQEEMQLPIEDCAVEAINPIWRAVTFEMPQSFSKESTQWSRYVTETNGDYHFEQIV
jgi:hypothetical protein